MECEVDEFGRAEIKKVMSRKVAVKVRTRESRESEEK
jgi:hypothetical protein